MIVLIRSSGGFVRRYSFLYLKEAGCGAEPIFDGRTADSYRLPPINYLVVGVADYQSWRPAAEEPQPPFIASAGISR